jgi:signal transduction histidine kinase
VCVGAITFLALLRFTKNAKNLAWFFGVTAMVGIWISSYIDHAGNTESFEIGAGYTPYMIVALVFVSLTGTRRSTLFFAALSIATLIGFYLIGGTLLYLPDVENQGRAKLILRCTSIILTTTIMIPVSQIIYGTLENLETALGRANRAEVARKELLATMSHEIRTPLNGIISVSDMLSKHKHDETTDTHLSIISLSAANLLEIVNESLGRARSDHLGDLDEIAVTVHHDPFDPAEILQQTCDLFTALADEKRLWIGTFGLDDLPKTLCGDAPHLRQVMNNLVGNAIKFTHKGGVRLGARALDKTEDGHVIQFFVQDTGVGIEPDALNKVFERFGQSASAQTTQLTGTGLGLSICDDLVSAMGGTLDVKSTLGSGSTFSFILTLPDPVGDVSRIAA